MRAQGLVLAAALLALAPGAGGCGPRQAPDEPATEAAFLTLQGWISLAGGDLSGYLRWDWIADDPGEYADPRSVCERWDQVTGARDQSILAAECPGCVEGLVLDTARVSTTCAGELGEFAGPSDWRIGFAPLDPQDDLGGRLADEGFTHLVYSDWAPEGTLDSMEAVFAAYPIVWTGPQGSPGSDDGTELSGDFELYALWYWSLGAEEG
ncbi:hypothetical protein L6R50_14240 [Myxococcota bacterium]|nr:hypothetical protein [Myxococcota bacterium]